MTNAPITPGTQPQQVSNKTINTEPQPLSITAKGGKNNANNTRKKDMMFLFFFRPFVLQMFRSLGVQEFLSRLTPRTIIRKRIFRSVGVTSEQARSASELSEPSELSE
jgi:hypothetical protein